MRAVAQRWVARKACSSQMHYWTLICRLGIAAEVVVVEVEACSVEAERRRSVGRPLKMAESENALLSYLRHDRVSRGVYNLQHCWASWVEHRWLDWRGCQDC